MTRLQEFFVKRGVTRNSAMKGGVQLALVACGAYMGATFKDDLKHLYAHPNTAESAAPVLMEKTPDPVAPEPATPEPVAEFDEFSSDLSGIVGALGNAMTETGARLNSQRCASILESLDSEFNTIKGIAGDHSKSPLEQFSSISRHLNKGFGIPAIFSFDQDGERINATINFDTTTTLTAKTLTLAMQANNCAKHLEGALKEFDTALSRTTDGSTFDNAPIPAAKPR